MKYFFTFLLVATIALSCNKDDVITTTPPTIILDSQTGVYTTKVGRSITIAPKYENVDKATYSWSIDNQIIASTPSLTYYPEQIGQFYIKLVVSNEDGQSEVEIRIDVVELEVPTISLAGADNGFTIEVNKTLRLTPIVKECSIATTYLWKVNGQKASTEKNYTFLADKVGDNHIAFTTTNEDGSDKIEFDVKVCTADDMPFNIFFAQKIYNYSTSRTIQLSPSQIIGGTNATYMWSVDGVEKQNSTSPNFICDIKQIGKHSVTMVATTAKGGKNITASTELEVNVCQAEGTYKKDKNGSSQASCNKIYEYTPAPGQFINELLTGGFTGKETTMESAINYVNRRFEKELFVSLGGFGGYIVVGFDHSIDNSGSYDIAILGNSFKDASEPGIVWVMQDENGDGKPNDTWYELCGSESEVNTTLHNYALTYYRPTGTNMAVQWIDENGNSGTIDYIKDIHKQDYYYPQWIKDNSYTLYGTCLAARNYDKYGDDSYWVLPAYDWGYADNFSSIDRLTDADNPNAEANANYFKISNAIDYSGKKIKLQYIDFIKVQTGVNTKSGNSVGEASTEVCGFYDYSLKK